MKESVNPKFLCALLLSILSFGQAFAGGVGGSFGNVSSTAAAISSGSGSSATVDINLDFKTPTFMGLAVYSSSGNNTNFLFSNPSSNFPGGTTFTAAESGGILLNNEGNLNSKFDLDGVASITDAATIINATNALSATPSQDIIIKGATYTNAAILTTLILTTSTNSVMLGGGSGTSPVYVFRAICGVPGGGASAINSQPTPAAGLILPSARRNVNGYSRFAIVGDLIETTVNSTTKGNWIGSFTITLTGI